MLIVILCVYLIVSAVGYWLRWLNYAHLKAYGQFVPAELGGAIDPAVLSKMSAYTAENSKVALVESVIDNVVVVLFLFAGMLGVYDRWIASFSLSFRVSGILFLLSIAYGQSLIAIPFSLYQHFTIENRYGFNTMTFKLWFTDLLKTFVLSSILGCIVIFTALSIVQASPEWWWLWVWWFFLLFGIFMMFISPYVIEPLFFKVDPIKEEGLEEKIRHLMEHAGLKVSHVFQMDASRRSRHSNAYFTGIGKVKRIVLFDTLIEQMTHDEILAVLAHEVGHWKKRHVLKRLAMTEVMAFCGLYLVYVLLHRDELPGLLGYTELSFYARFLIIGFLGSLVMFPLTPLFSALSRRDEREADVFAAELTGHPENMASALVKLSRENLSNLHPHPWYAAFYYSHPPVVERIRQLKTGASSQ
jgi:STE24 endopeptidase